MPTLSEDFLNPYFWASLGSSIKYGLLVLLGIGSFAALMTFATGGTAPRHWPKKDEPGEAHH